MKISEDIKKAFMLIKEITKLLDAIDRHYLYAPYRDFVNRVDKISELGVYFLELEEETNAQGDIMLEYGNEPWYGEALYVFSEMMNFLETVQLKPTSMHDYESFLGAGTDMPYWRSSLDELII